MRRKSTPIVFAALLVATTSAHASFFPGSSLTKDADRDPAGDAIAAIAKVGLLEDITDWAKGFHSEGAVVGSSASEDLAENEGCTEDRAAQSKKSRKHSSKSEKPNEDEDSKPSGPEPIYFGF